MSRRRTKLEFQKVIATLKTDISSQIQQTLSRELSKLELAAATSMPTPSSLPPAPVPQANPTESTSVQQAATVTISATTARNLYAVIESVEDLVYLERQGKRKSFEAKAIELEALIAAIDTEMLEKIDLTA